MKEEWTDIAGYEGIYKISNRGNIYSLSRIRSGERYVRIGGKYLKPYPTKFGHLYCYLYKDGKKKQGYIHRLVYEAFVGKIRDGLEIDHVDRNPANNVFTNLRAITHRKNVSLGHNKRLLPTGVYRSPSGNYYSQIANGGERISLGTYTTVEEASNLYLLKREEFERALLRV